MMIRMDCVAADLGWHTLNTDEKLLVLHDQASHNHTCIERVEESMNGRFDKLMVTLRWGVGLAVIILIVVCASYTNQHASQINSPAAYHIGVMVPLTGPSASFGERVRNDKTILRGSSGEFSCIDNERASVGKHSLIELERLLHELGRAEIPMRGCNASKTEGF